MRRPVLVAAAACLLSFGAFCLAQRLAYVSYVDLLVYRAEGRAVLTGGDLYAIAVGRARLPATYPPAAALLFTPLAVLPPTTLKVLGVLANLGLLLAFAGLSLRLTTGRRPGTATVLWAAAAAVWCEPVWGTLRYGQVNLLLAVAVLWDLTRPRGHRWAGAGTGLAAAVKLTPALFAAFLLTAGLVRALRARRLPYAPPQAPRAPRTGPAAHAPYARPGDGPGAAELRAAGVAGGVFCAVGAVAWAVLPGASRTYWTSLVLDSGRAGYAEETANQSLRGVLARLLHTGHPGLPWAAAALAAGAAGLAVAVRAELRGDRAAAVVATALTALLVSPISWSHHWIWCLPATLLVRERAGRRPALACWLAFCSYALWWAVPHGPDRPELGLSAVPMAASALYALAAAGVLVMLWRTSRSASECSARRAGGRRSARPPARGTSRSGRLL